MRAVRSKAEIELMILDYLAFEIGDAVSWINIQRDDEVDLVANWTARSFGGSGSTQARNRNAVVEATLRFQSKVDMA